MDFVTFVLPRIIMQWSPIFVIIGVIALFVVTQSYMQRHATTSELVFVVALFMINVIALCTVLGTWKYETFTDTEYDIERLAEDNQAKRVKADEYMLRHGHYLWFDYWELDDPNCERTSTPQPSEDNSYKDYLRETA